jgi:N-acetylmuramoyl-L-alanine amidase
MADVAVVIGHHPEAPGAPLDLAGYTVHEHELWAPFARELALTLWQKSVATDVVERPNHDPDQALADRVNATGARAAIELHFNASRSEEATGCDMLHYPGSAEGKRLAAELERRAAEALSVPARHRDTVDYPFTRLTEMPAVICEPAFGSSDGDAFKLLSELPDLMQAYRHGLMTFLDGGNA